MSPGFVAAAVAGCARGAAGAQGLVVAAAAAPSVAGAAGMSVFGC